METAALARLAGCERCSDVALPVEVCASGVRTRVAASSTRGVRNGTRWWLAGLLNQQDWASTHMFYFSAKRFILTGDWGLLLEVIAR